MNIADFWRKLIKELFKPKLNIKTCFLELFYVLFYLEASVFMSGQYFLCFLGENPYFIKKSRIWQLYIVNS